MANVPRIMLIGGGTGGHIYPLVAVAQQLRELELHYFGSPGPFHDYLAQNGIKIHKIVSSKFRRYFSLLNFVDALKFLLSLLQGLWKIFWVMPEVAFSKGGPGALAIVLICRFYRIPLVIHESDSLPGLTTRISARYARKIWLAFPETKKHLNVAKIKGEINVVGQPVRKELLIEEGTEQARNSFGLDPENPTLLILGGSQGSEVINNFVLNNLENLITKFQMIHSIGPMGYTEYKQEYDFISQKISPQWLKGYYFASYLSIVEKERGLNAAYSAADIVISRAGAGAIFEIAEKGKPSILIPLPSSANGHQERNADIYAETGAAKIMEEENLLENIFINEVSKILNDPDLSKKMSTAARAFYKPKATDDMANGILSIIAGT